MNTADRSIALLDAALRRRFRFVGFFPDSPPIKGVLRRWLAATQKEFGWVADVVDAANAKLPQRDLQIGPSYFMTPGGLTETWVERIWKYSVMPYIEEQFFGETERILGYDLAQIRAALTIDVTDANSHSSVGETELVSTATGEDGPTSLAVDEP
jgi:5-methylcytosine-specific restriction protein B